MFDFDWPTLVLCALLLGKALSVKVKIDLDLVALLKYLEERKKDKKDR